MSTTDVVELRPPAAGALPREHQQAPQGHQAGSARGIAAGSSHTVALRQDGTLWAWGDNGQGQLGDGTIINRSSPVLVTGF